MTGTTMHVIKAVEELRDNVTKKKKQSILPDLVILGHRF